MTRPWKGKIALDIREATPDWEPFIQPQAPEGSPNILYIVWDDVGYGTMDTFGGPVETPNMTRIADSGIRFSNFHTTALCSPTRSCLLTGRNATSNNMACVTEAAGGFPGISARIPFENGTIAEVLNERGWNTYAVGKWHLTPGEETDVSSWKGRWPLGRGFERFYGFIGGETSQWYPDLVYDNHPIDQPYAARGGVSPLQGPCRQGLSSSSRMRRWWPRTSPGSCTSARDAAHAPHHVFKEWADRYKGRFDMGYEEIRTQILAEPEEDGSPAGIDRALAHQPARGARCPRGRTGSHGRNSISSGPGAPFRGREDNCSFAWPRSLPGSSPTRITRLGRILDYLQESGQLENTIIVVVSDNGASGEGGPDGPSTRCRFFNNVPDDIKDEPRSISTNSAARSPTTTTAAGGRGPSTRRSRYLETVCRVRRRDRRHVRRGLAEGDPGRGESSATSTSMPSTSCRHCTRCSASSLRRS